jgi:hypothetical protein
MWLEVIERLAQETARGRSKAWTSSMMPKACGLVVLGRSTYPQHGSGAEADTPEFRMRPRVFTTETRLDRHAVEVDNWVRGHDRPQSAVDSR